MNQCAARYHDTSSAYRRGCRCPAAIEAASLHRRAYRAGARRYVDAEVTVRKLRALAAAGWSQDKLAEALGVQPENVWAWTRRPRPVVHVATAEKVDRLYRKLEGTPAPLNPHTRRTRTIATRQGYAPPLAWDDIERDDGPVDAFALAPTADEIRAEVRWLGGGGESPERIAARVGCSVAVAREVLGLPRLTQKDAACRRGHLFDVHGALDERTGRRVCLLCQRERGSRRQSGITTTA